MDAGSILYEIESIDKELVRLRKATRELGQRKKNLSNQLIETLRESGERQVTHNGKTYQLEEQYRHDRKPDKQKKQDAVQVLQEEGYTPTEAEEIYAKLTDALRGPEKTIYTIKN